MSSHRVRPTTNCVAARAPRSRGAEPLRLAVVLTAFVTAAGCGTTNWTDTSRTATEQLLISDAMDRAISQIDFDILAGKEVFFDPQYLKGTTDENYLVSSLRQHLMASGVILQEKREDAMYVVEARTGATGTDRHSLLFGIPALSLPFTSIPGAPVGLPSTLPEIALAKDTKQKAVSKVAVFAYNRTTGMPVWQSGVARAMSDAKASWVFGAGPFEKGSIYDGTKFAGGKLDLPLVGGPQSGKPDHGSLEQQDIPVTAEAIFPESVPILSDAGQNDHASTEATPSAEAPAAETAVAPAAPTAAAPPTAAATPAAGANAPAQVTRLPSVAPRAPLRR